MNLDIFHGLPVYVRITILSQIRRLLSTPMFNYEDREDLAQDLLLFYLKRFYSIPNLDEALVVHGLKQYATNLLVKRYHRRDFLYSSLADYADEEFSFTGNEKTDDLDRIMLSELPCLLDGKEKLILELIYAGCSANEISTRLHVHKRVIRRLFEKLRKILK